MKKIKALILSAAMAAAALLAPSKAAAIECDQLTSGMGLCLPRYGTDGDQWATAIINAFTLINSSGIINSTSSVNNMKELYVSRIGGISTSPLMVRFSSSVYFDAGTYLVTAGSVTISSSNFSVGGSTLVVTGGTVFMGTTFGFMPGAALEAWRTDAIPGINPTAYFLNLPSSMLATDIRFSVWGHFVAPSGVVMTSGHGGGGLFTSTKTRVGDPSYLFGAEGRPFCTGNETGCDGLLGFGDYKSTYAARVPITGLRGRCTNLDGNGNPRADGSCVPLETEAPIGCSSGGCYSARLLGSTATFVAQGYGFFGSSTAANGGRFTVVGQAADAYALKVSSADGTAQLTVSSNGATGIGTGSPHASTLLDIISTTKAIRPPVMTSAQMNAIASPTTGFMVSNSDNGGRLSMYLFGAWRSITEIEVVAFSSGTSDFSTTAAAFTGITGTTTTITTSQGSAVIAVFSYDITTTLFETCPVRFMRGSAILGPTAGHWKNHFASDNAMIMDWTAGLNAGTYTFSVMTYSIGGASCQFEGGGDRTWNLILLEVKI